MRFFFFSPITTIIEIYRSFACVHIPHSNCADTVSFAFVALWCDESWSHLVSVDKRLTIFDHKILRFFFFLIHRNCWNLSIDQLRAFILRIRLAQIQSLLLLSLCDATKGDFTSFCWQSINHTRPWGIALFFFSSITSDIENYRSDARVHSPRIPIAQMLSLLLLSLCGAMKADFTWLLLAKHLQCSTMHKLSRLFSFFNRRNYWNLSISCARSFSAFDFRKCFLLPSFRFLYMRRKRLSRVISPSVQKLLKPKNKHTFKRVT